MAALSAGSVSLSLPLHRPSNLRGAANGASKVSKRCRATDASIFARFKVGTLCVSNDLCQLPFGRDPYSDWLTSSC